MPSEDPYTIQSDLRLQQNEDRSPSKHPSNFVDKSKLRLIEPDKHLGYFSTGALILNKMVGTGIVVTPSMILEICGSKGMSIVLWFVGGIITCAGWLAPSLMQHFLWLEYLSDPELFSLAVYLEYGIRFPLTGGELHYIDYVWRRPKYLMTYVYSIMYVILSGSQANALIFGNAVLTASTPDGAYIDRRLQKFFAIALVGCICTLQSFSRVNYIRFSNCFVIYKISFLFAIIVMGLSALRSNRTTAAAATNTSYGAVNLKNSFRGTTLGVYPVALAMLDIMRVYSGYENANFVLEEVRRPCNDETKVFRQAAKFTIWLVSFLYIMVNVALFAACSTDELLQSSDVLSLFFTKVFGPSPKTRTASGILLAISSTGNVMSTTFAAVRVKQEIARLGILPLPWFWAKSTRLDTPGPALLLHWICSMIFIAACPLDSPNGYLVFSTIFNYGRTLVGIVLGGALLFAPRLQSFSLNGEPWTPKSSKLGLKLIYPLTMIYVLANLFVFVFSWFPSETFQAQRQVVSSFLGPAVVITCVLAGAVYWVWDRHLLRLLGYRLETLQEYKEGFDVHLSFERHLDGFAKWIVYGKTENENNRGDK